MIKIAYTDPLLLSHPLEPQSAATDWHLEVELEPLQRLLKRPFLCPLLLGDTQVTTHREAMGDAREEVDLVGRTNFCKFCFRLVAELSSEDCVGFCGVLSTLLIDGGKKLTSSGNRHRSLDCGQLLNCDKTGMRIESRIDTAGQQPGDIFGSEAVSNGTDLLWLQLSLDSVQHRVHDWHRLLRHMVLQPALYCGTLGGRQNPWVAVENVGHDHVVPGGGEAVGQDLGVDEFVAHGVGEV